MSAPSIREQLNQCVDCGAPIFRTCIRLTGGTLTEITVEAPADEPKHTREHWRLDYGNGGWHVDPAGAFVEHSLDRCNEVAAGQ